MADLNQERAKESARNALDFLNAEKFRNANWRDEAPWGQRQDLAYALDLLQSLAATTLNLADRVTETDRAIMKLKIAMGYAVHHLDGKVLRNCEEALSGLYKEDI